MSAVPAVIQQAPQMIAAPDEPSIGMLLDKAIERGLPVESLEKLVALHERVQAKRAAQEFAVAMAEFQAACPPIAKTSTAKVTSKRTGGTYSYRYAELDEIATTINPLLHQRGLSYSWDSQQADGILTCTCTLRHVNGHSITATFSLPVENDSAMSKQQEHAAALTYARRQSLVQVCGLTTTDPDTDGAGGHERVTEDMATQLNDLITEAGINKERFLKHFGVALIADIPKGNYHAALTAIESWKRSKAKGGAA